MPGRLPGQEEDVLRHGVIVIELHLLVDHLDAQAMRDGDAERIEPPAGELHRPRTGPQVAADDHAEGGLARAVLSDQGVDH